MKFYSGLLIGGWFAAVVSPAPALAGNEGATIGIHLSTNISRRSACAPAVQPPSCAEMQTAGSLLPTKYFAYVVIHGGDVAAGVGGLQFGITYDSEAQRGVDVFDWRLCKAVDFQADAWPAPSSGNMVSWPGTSCQRIEPGGPGSGVVAVAGYFYCAAYGSDTFRIMGHPSSGVAKVLACDGRESVLDQGETSGRSQMGYASFSSDGSVGGYKPCAREDTFGSLVYQAGTDQPVPTKPGVAVSMSSAAGQRSATVTFVLQESGIVRLGVFDVAGRLVKDLASGQYAGGVHHLNWNLANAGGDRVPSGIYFIRLEAQGGNQSARFVIAQ